MKNIEKNCLQGLKRQNKLLANTKCVKKLVCISKKRIAEVHKLKTSLQRQIFHTSPPPFQENNGPSLSAEGDKGV